MTEDQRRLGHLRTALELTGSDGRPLFPCRALYPGSARRALGILAAGDGGRQLLEQLRAGLSRERLLELASRDVERLPVGVGASLPLLDGPRAALLLRLWVSGETELERAIRGGVESTDGARAWDRLLATLLTTLEPRMTPTRAGDALVDTLERVGYHHRVLRAPLGAEVWQRRTTITSGPLLLTIVELSTDGPTSGYTPREVYGAAGTTLRPDAGEFAELLVLIADALARLDPAGSDWSERLMAKLTSRR